MKRLIFAFFALFILSGCGAQPLKAEYKKITAAEAKGLMDKGGVIVLDVRTKEEFNHEHIENAVLIPYDKIKDSAQSALPDKNAMVLIYCRTGRRSEIAARELIKMGYTNVYDFGGIVDWKYKTVKGEDK